MIRRDRKGRFACPPISPEILAERALLAKVRSVLSLFGGDIADGGTLGGASTTLVTFTAGLQSRIKETLEAALNIDRPIVVREQPGHAGRVRYSVFILTPKDKLTQGAPAAPAHGGPLASAEVSA